jgi:hypothetical protein
VLGAAISGDRPCLWVVMIGPAKESLFDMSCRQSLTGLSPRQRSQGFDLSAQIPRLLLRWLISKVFWLWL